MNKVKLCIKQGEELNIGFTVKENGSPLDLSNYNGIRVQVKKAPLEKFPAMIDKMITTTSDINDVGQINYPQQGQFVLHLNKEDTSFPATDYSLVISLEGNHLSDIISSNCCSGGIFRICEQ